MIIDADVHISPSHEEGGVSSEQVVAAMQRSGVDKALCWLQPPYMRHVEREIDYIRGACMKYPEQLLPFGWIDPHLGTEYALDLTDRCLRQYGFYGVKLNGAQNAFSLDDPALDPIIEMVAASGKLLALHIGDEMNNTHPSKVASIAARWPAMPILLVHMGGAACNMEEACIEFAKAYPSLYLIGSSVDYRYVLKAIRILGASRVLFGSDMPFSDMHADVAGYRAFLSAYCSQREQDMVMGGNLARLLNLQGGNRFDF